MVWLCVCLCWLLLDVGVCLFVSALLFGWLFAVLVVVCVFVCVRLILAG